MKKFKKIFIAALLALTVAALPVSALAAEPDEGYNAAEDQGYETGEGDLADATNEASENEGDVTAENDSEAAENEGVTAPENEGENQPDDTPDAEKNQSVTEAPEEESKNTFEELYKLCMSHLAEILSLAAFVGSLASAILYKSGMLPLIKQGLSAISKTAHSIKESAELGELTRKSDYDGLKTKLDGLEKTLSGLSENLTDCAERLESKKALENRQKRMEALTEAELEMLYEIFMTSALPEYEKARIGEKIAKMKEVISTYEGE